MSGWSAGVRWFPWRRAVRAGAVLESWPRMVDGPASLLARLGWLLVGVPLLVCWAVELLVGVLLLPFALLARAAGWLPWWVELRARGCLGGLVRTGGHAEAARVRAALRADPLDAAPAGYPVREVVISVRRWELAVRDAGGCGRRRWFLWRRRTSVADALEWFPDRALDDVLWLVLALPFLLVGFVWLVVSGAELLAELVVLPFVLVLRSVRVLGWPIELVHGDEVSPHRVVRGFGASARARRELTEQERVVVPHPQRAARSVVGAGR
ncbi:hypothetical protein ABZ805_01450 [Saccharopolyspora sp. NPDC047091]|uniref:hypothetical protein n=1 Tax=Saccharopolyspora sp. NPDC047091 TaxID=3155924 RepID=UPI0033D35C78